MGGEAGPLFAARRLGVLVSGRGSNLQAILDAVGEARLEATVALVVSNVAGAQALERARAAGVPTLTIEHAQFPTRAAFDGALLAALRSHQVDLVCLAGFMRLLGRAFVESYRHAILNVHPSLLPAFPGLHAQAQAVRHGVKLSGATVHLVDADLDSGPIVLQACVPVHEDDTEESLSSRILIEEHRIYPEAIRLVLAGGWRIEGRRFVGPPVRG
ncbi:MAG: phosphoribosylglycinamide formyltransferase [Vicinamibacterales bacterium]|nr:phosphoribosylglycinamide formyltransferase [Vicinamibacterales bacterium]